MDKFVIRVIVVSRILIAGFFLSTVGVLIIDSLTSIRVSEAAKVVGILGIAYLVLYILNAVFLLGRKERARKDALYLDWGIIIFDSIFFLGMNLIPDIRYGGFNAFFYAVHGSLVIVLSAFIWVLRRPAIKGQFM